MKTTFNQFINEAYKFKSLNFNSHTNHNPECDILEGHIDSDTFITYGIYVKGSKKGSEFMEYYSGSNYKTGSSKRSNSKMYDANSIPSKYKTMWEDLKAEYENNYASLAEALITEGQFSWMTQDTGNQIGSEKENTIAVTMFDNKGGKWLERKYDGYGEFGGKDYYELLAQMNGIENANRQDGIDLAFGKQRIKGKVLFPALIEDPKYFNYKKHDFTQEAPNDPNQSWYQEPEDEDDYFLDEDVSFKDGKYHFYSKNGMAYLTHDEKELSSGDFDRGADSYFMSHSSFKGQKSFEDGKDVIAYFKKNKIVNESAVTKLADKLMDMDYTVFKSLGLRSGGELYSNKMMQKKYTDAMKAAIDKAGIADTITKNGQAIYDELEDNNYHSTNAFLVLGGYILPKLIGMYKEIAKSSPNSTLQPFNESLVTEAKVTFHFEEFDNSLHFSDGAIVKIDYDGDFEYRSKWFTTDSDVEKQLNKAFSTEKFIHETTKDK